MEDRWGPDPTHQLWTRWRRPILIVLAVLLVGNQWERLTSGQPFAVATGIGAAGFWISLLFGPGAPPAEQRNEVDAWRRHGRRAAVVFGCWAVVAWVWLGMAAYLYSVGPINFLVPAVPTLLTVAHLWGCLYPERAAQNHRRAAQR